jgi:hypothetical protein
MMVIFTLLFQCEILIKYREGFYILNITLHNNEIILKVLFMSIYLFIYLLQCS